MGPRNDVLDGLQILHGKGQFWGKGPPTVEYRDFCHQLCKNGWTNQDAMWLAESSGSRIHVLDGGPDPPREGTILRGKGIPDMPDSTLTWAVQKRLNRSRCHLGCGLKEPCTGWGTNLPIGRSNFEGKEHALTCPTTLWCELCNRDAMWDAEASWP